jgi:hypothetical protein
LNKADLQGFSAGRRDSLPHMYFAVSISELDRSFIAGFLEGEATLAIKELNGGQSLSCLISLNQRDADSMGTARPSSRSGAKPCTCGRSPQATLAGRSCAG